MFYANYHIFLRAAKSSFSLSIYYLLGLFFLFFMACSGNVYGVTDTTLKKQQYNINDPRNPDCPCHKYQKMAEEEYVNKTLQPFDSDVNHKVVEDETSSPIVKKNKNLQKDIKTPVDIHHTNPPNTNKKIRLRIVKIKFQLYRICRKALEIKVHPNYCVCYKWH